MPRRLGLPQRGEAEDETDREESLVQVQEQDDLNTSLAQGSDVVLHFLLFHVAAMSCSVFPFSHLLLLEIQHSFFLVFHSIKVLLV